MPMLIGMPMKRGGRRLAKQRLIFDGKAAELPEAVARSDGGHRCRVRLCLSQRPPRQMHAAEQQITLGRHSQMLLAALAQCPLRNPDRLAHLRNEEGSCG